LGYTDPSFSESFRNPLARTRTLTMKWIVGVGLALLMTAGALAQDMPLSQVLIDGETWKQVGQDLDHLWGLVADRDGNIYVTDPRQGGVIRIATDGKQTTLAEKEKGLAALACGRDGKVYVSQTEKKRILALEGDNVRTFAEDVAVRSLAVTAKGAVYALAADDKILLIGGDGKGKVVAQDLGFPTSLSLWPDSGTLVVGDSEGAHLWALRINGDGSLSAREKYYTPVRERPGEPAYPMALTADSAGRMYAATSHGVEVFDPTGRPCGVLLKPAREHVTGVAFGGKDGDQLFILCGGKLYARKTLAKGVR
jgi:gluconolactonase